MKRRVLYALRYGQTGRGAWWCETCKRVLDRGYFGRLRGHTPSCSADRRAVRQAARSADRKAKALWKARGADYFLRGSWFAELASAPHGPGTSAADDE